VVIFQQINTIVTLVCSPASPVIFCRASIGIWVAVEKACSYEIGYELEL